MAKKARKEILIGVAITVLGGAALSIWQFAFDTATDYESPSEEVQMIGGSDSYQVTVGDFYRFDEGECKLIGGKDEVPYYMQFGLQTSLYRVVMLADVQTGVRQNKLDTGHYLTRHFSTRSIELLAGVPVINPEVEQHEQVETSFYNARIKDGFAHYNPAIIQWAHENLIPDPEMIGFNGFAYQLIYDRMFKETMRLLVQSYLSFPDEESFVKEQNRYLEAMKSPDFDGASYLRRNYDVLTDEYYYSIFSPALAKGFWLRRGMDGTSLQVWQGLRKVMLMYDKEWFDNINTVQTSLFENPA